MEFDTNIQNDGDNLCPDCDGEGEVQASLTQIICDIEICKTCGGTGYSHDELIIEPYITPSQALDYIRSMPIEDQRMIARICIDAINAEGFYVSSRGNNLLQAEQWRNLFEGLCRSFDCKGLL